MPQTARPLPPSRGRALPGLQTPGAGVEQPFELLDACHDRVRRSLDLLGRLITRWRTQGADSQVRDAARDVLRYFDIAAPLHHEDEERHVLPALQASGDPALVQAASLTLAEHRQFRALWARARVGLQALQVQAMPADEDWLQAAGDFIALHGPHLAREDSLLFPAAAALQSSAAQGDMVRDMAQRRGLGAQPAQR